MQPLHYDKKAGPSPQIKALVTKKPTGGAVIASVTPKGPRLKLEAVLDRIYVSDPDADQNEGMIGLIHMPAGVAARPVGYARLRVISVGPMVKSVVAGDEIIVPRGPVQKLIFEGQIYHWVGEANIEGVVRGLANP